MQNYITNKICVINSAHISFSIAFMANSFNYFCNIVDLK